MHAIKTIFLLLAAMATLSLAQDFSSSNPSPSAFYGDSAAAEKLALDTQIDYEGHYMNLIQQEEKAISQKTKLGLLGATLMGFGGLMTVIYLNDGVDADGQESLEETVKMEALIFSIGLTAIGAFGLTYNLYALYNKDGHYSRLDSYKRAHDIYKRRRGELSSGPQLALIPTLDIEGAGAGLNAILLF